MLPNIQPEHTPRSAQTQYSHLTQVSKLRCWGHIFPKCVLPLAIQQARGRVWSEATKPDTLPLLLFDLSDGCRRNALTCASGCSYHAPVNLERLQGPGVTHPCDIWSVLAESLPCLQNALLPPERSKESASCSGSPYPHSSRKTFPFLKRSA